MGDISVGFFGGCRWAAFSISRAYDSGDGEAEWEMVDHAESHFGGGAGAQAATQRAGIDAASLIRMIESGG